jgi:hypothetical protein
MVSQQCALLNMQQYLQAVDKSVPAVLSSASQSTKIMARMARYYASNEAAHALARLTFPYRST